VARTMTETEAAWLAGFIDGEGSIVTYRSGKGFPCWQLTIPNTHVGSLAYVKEITGAGYVRRKPSRGERKPQFIYVLTAQRDMEHVVKQVLPFLRIKRLSAEAFLGRPQA